MKNKGFTLIEIIAVILIIGIILGLSIPAVTALQKRLIKQRVNRFYIVLEEAVDLYVDEHHKDYDKNASCYKLSYDSLVKEDLLKETDITCLSTANGNNEGIIIAKRVGDNNTFTYFYYLKCYDKKSNSDFVKLDNLPINCVELD